MLTGRFWEEGFGCPRVSMGIDTADREGSGNRKGRLIPLSILSREEHIYAPNISDRDLHSLALLRPFRSQPRTKSFHGSPIGLVAGATNVTAILMRLGEGLSSSNYPRPGPSMWTEERIFPPVFFPRSYFRYLQNLLKIYFHFEVDLTRFLLPF